MCNHANREVVYMLEQLIKLSSDQKNIWNKTPNPDQLKRRRPRCRAAKKQNQCVFPFWDH